MISSLLKKIFYGTGIFLTGSILFFSCQKELSGENNGTPGQPADLTTKVTISTASGFITDENNAPVKDAVVQLGTSTTNSDKFGYFEFKNTEVVKNAAFVSVTKPGYFKGFKTFTATAGKGFFTRIKLIPKTITGNINAASGGNVTLSNGLIISLPANAVVNASTGAAYSGTIGVAAFHINPEAADLNEIMPGDLRGINKTGALKLLQTYGMAAVELTGSGGELLQIASGKKATLTMPIPASLSATAPASIPLWYFDETNGLWKEEGSAVKTGNTYVGDVAHFSFWNCDIPLGSSVHFDCTIVDSSGNPIPYANIWISYYNGTITGCHGITDLNGYLGGDIPANAQLSLNLQIFPSCSATPLFSQTFTSTSSNLSLGTITIGYVSSGISILSGTLSNCNGQPVTNGYVKLKSTYSEIYLPVNAGNFKTFVTLCNNSNIIQLTGIDIAGNQQGNPTTLTLMPGSTSAGNIVACGNSVPEFISYNVNSTQDYFALPVDQVNQLTDSTSINSIRIWGGRWVGNKYVEIGFDKTAIATGSTQNLTYFHSTETGTPTTIPAPIQVHITEYGAVGQYIAGNFTGNITGPPPTSTQYAVSYNFRVKRLY